MRRKRLHILARAVLIAALLFAPGAPPLAQPAFLMADRVQVIGSGRILAEGNVVVTYGGTRLTASRVVYDEAGDRLSIEGPITLTEPGGTYMLADAADLSADLREGILESARVVLEEQLQIAAVEINRVDGRYTQMSKVTASSCEVCFNRPVPLWAIRAARVVHDQEAHQLYFHDAQLRVAGIPVFYLPRLRLPDPTLTRATGFLTPSLRLNTSLGTGIRMPYFMKLGDHADLTLAPFVSAITTTLEARYRQVFRSGEMQFDMALSHDDLEPGLTRYHLTGSGAFALGRGYRLNFETAQVSDPAYLSDYGYSDQDRLHNGVSVSRVRRDASFFAGVGKYSTLRAAEIPIADQLPFAQADFLYERRLAAPLIGGTLGLQLYGHGHFRESTLDVLGRDMMRLGCALDWRRDWLLGNGMIVEARGELAADAYWIQQDAGFAPYLAHATPSAALTLRWPMARRAAVSGAVDVLEPVAQIAWTDEIGAAVPNEDSLFVEFDEANLFDLSRFPGYDRRERGLRANLGLTWTHQMPDGLSFTLAGGKVLRAGDLGQFTAASGLSGVSSDWLVAGQVQAGDRLFVQSRALFDDDFSLTKAETRAAWTGERLALATGHLWVMADPGENRPDPTHEWLLDASYDFNSGWNANVDWRFDIEEREATKAGLGLGYANECIAIDLSLSRRFTSSDTVNPTTDVGLTVSVPSFGGRPRGASRGCGG